VREKRILVADDEPNILQSVKLVLRKRGIKSSPLKMGRRP
jgi:hypothetical protein